MILRLREQKSIIHESSVNNWLEMRRTVFQPNVFKMTMGNVGSKEESIAMPSHSP